MVGFHLSTKSADWLRCSVCSSGACLFLFDMVFMTRGFPQFKPPTKLTIISVSPWPTIRVVMECCNPHPIATHLAKFHDTVKSNISMSPRLFGHRTRISCGGYSSSHDLSMALDFVPIRPHYQDQNGKASVAFDSDDLQNSYEDEMKEAERRRKIGLANRGRVPWNKGRQHSEETRARISERTMLALRDPKVRRKMSEAPRKLSDQVKAKISFSQKQVWGERLKLKRARDKFYMSWRQNIAQAARKGGLDEEELSWDSYSRIKNEMALQIAKRAEEEANVKQIKKVLAENAAQAKAEKFLFTLWKAEDKETKKRTKRKIKKQEKEECQLKSHLTKMRRKTSKAGRISSQMPVRVSRQLSMEKLDLEFAEMAKQQKKVPLADEIRAAKRKRTESRAMEELASSLTE